jgi:FkbM family methyltransferase
LTLSHALNNISRYRKRYGYSKGLRAFIHYGYVGIKKPWLNPNKQNIITVNGCKLEIIPGDPLGTSAELLMFKTHEPVSTKLISKLLKKGMTCLDIGANIGYYVLLENKLVGEEGKIIAIEPSPENFEYLQKNIKLQNTQSIQAFNIAVGNTEGKIKFLVYENASNSGMVIPDGEEQKWPGEVIEVPIIKVDSLLQEKNITKIDFLRMDVEGYEFHIFEGMQETLNQHKPIIHIEVHKSIMGDETTKKWFKMMQKFGYEVKYYVPREIDTPMIGTINDVKSYTLEELTSMLDNKLLPSFFMLSLINKNLD